MQENEWLAHYLCQHPVAWGQIKKSTPNLDYRK